MRIEQAALALMLVTGAGLMILQMPRTTLLVRGGGPPQTLAGELRNAIWSLERNLPDA